MVAAPLRLFPPGPATQWVAESCESQEKKIVIALAAMRASVLFPATTGAARV